MKKQEKTNPPQASRKAASPRAVTALWQRRWFFELLIAIFCLVLFANSVPNDYNLDDELVTINHRLTSQGISAIPEIIASPYYQDQSGYSYDYRPVVLISFAIEHQLFGDAPHWSHFWNLVLYTLACIVLYRALRLLFRDHSPFFAAAITLFFAAHPTHTEVVDSIKNRDEILGLLFGLLSMMSAVRLMRDRRAWIHWITTPLFFALALLSKLTFLSFVIIIPLVLLAFEEVSLIRFLFVVASMSAITLVTSGIGTTVTRLLLLFASVAGALLLYSLRYFAEVRSTIRQRLSAWRLQDAFSYHDEDSRGGDISVILRGSLPGISWRYVVVCLLLVGAFIASVVYSLYDLQLLAGVILALLLFYRDEAVSAYAFMSMLVVVLFRIYWLHIFADDPLYQALIVLMIYTIMYSSRRFLIPAVLTLIAVPLLGIQAGITIQSFVALAPIAVILLLLQRYKYAWVLIVVINIFPYVGGASHFYPVFLFFTALLLAVYVKKWSLPIDRAALILILGVVLYTQVSHPVDTALVTRAGHSIDAVDTRISALSSYRPVQYVENFLNYQTPMAVRLGTSLEVLWHYLGKTILPYRMSFYYGYSFITPMRVSDTIPALSLIVHLVLLALAAGLWRRQRILSVGILIYLASVIVFSNFQRPIPGMVADRFLLIPSLGWALVFVSLIQLLFRIDFRRGTEQFHAISAYARYTFMAILLLYTGITIVRNNDWKDYLSLYRHDLAYVDSSSQAHNLLALRLMIISFNTQNPVEQRSMREEALTHFKRAVQIYPSFFNANYDIGRVYLTLNQPDSAIPYLRRTIEMDSSFTTAAATLGDIYLSRSDDREAEKVYVAMIKAMPADPSGYEKLHNLYSRQGDYARVIDLNQKSIPYLPKLTRPYINIAKAYYALDRKDSAAAWLHRALAVSPGDVEASGLLQSLQPSAVAAPR